MKLRLIRRRKRMKHRRRLGLTGLNSAPGIARGEKQRRRWADPLVTMATENGQPATLEGTAEQSNGGKESLCRQALLPPDPEAEETLENKEETLALLFKRHLRNLVHFFVEDWFISGMLGFITAALSISVDVGYEYLNHYRAVLPFPSPFALLGFVSWVGFMVVFVGAAALVCKYVSVQAIGSGIPEVKVIMNGFMLQNYLSFRTLVAKVLSLTLTLGSGLPVGKEGPFVHMGAIVGTLLCKVTRAWQSSAFFSNEGREIEILSSGCSVGIACTFSSPAGAVLYGIECTHKYFAVKNYWRAFFATTCAALIFRFANAVIIPPHIAGTITAYYQTSFPNEVFLVEEIPVFVLVGLLSGLFGALFVVFHRRIAYFKKRNRTFRAIFGKNSLAFTIFMALIVGIVTFPDGLGRFIAGKYTFRETLGDFIANCSMSLYNVTSMGCGGQVIQRWTIEDLWAEEGPRRKSVLDSIDESTDTTAFMPNPFPVLFGYLIVNFFLVAICITLALPAGIFVPSFVIGACGGRIIGELMVVVFPEGIRGLDGPQIYPGLYAVVGAAAYTGAVTHSLSIAVIVCETTGQLSALLPVLIALMVANAVSSFLQPSIYESIINIRKLPHLAELPPSRISVHTLKVEQIMVRDVVFVTKQTTYKELRELLICTPHLRSYPLVTDEEERILLGSVARKYLHYLLTSHLGPDPALLLHGSRRRKSRNPSGFSNEAAAPAQHKMSMINDRNVFGNTLLSISPLHDDQGTKRGRLMPLLMRHQKEAISLSQTRSLLRRSTSVRDRTAQLRKPIDLDEVAIDAAPFQLVIGTSLYRVHTLFALLGLNHAYVTNRGRLVGVVALRELRAALAHIYTRGALPAAQSMSRLRLNSLNFGLCSTGRSRENSGEENSDNANTNSLRTDMSPNSLSGPLTQSTTVTSETSDGTLQIVCPTSFSSSLSQQLTPFLSPVMALAPPEEDSDEEETEEEEEWDEAKLLLEGAEDQLVANREANRAVSRAESNVPPGHAAENVSVLLDPRQRRRAPEKSNQIRSQNVPSSLGLSFSSSAADGTANAVPQSQHQSVIVHTQQTMATAPEAEENGGKKPKKRGRKRKRKAEDEEEADQQSDEDEEGAHGLHTDASPGAIGVRRFINPFEPRAIIPLPHELEMSTHGTTVWRRNERERQRVQQLNFGYTHLRERLPLIDRDRRMSKVDSLRLAIAYIRHLELLLHHGHAHWAECHCFKQSYGGGDGRSSGAESTPPPN
uniref:BHLH domain-containing protein n=1 Tax=Globodera rostochiensis TaxID=31243 RepID=A0A914HQ07_GLORO